MAMPVTEHPHASRLPHPPMFSAFALRAGMRLAGPGDVRSSQAQIDRFRDYSSQGDPLADAVAAWMRGAAAGQGRRLFERALEQGIDSVPEAPEELRALFAQLDPVPYWLDTDKLDLAARVIGRTGLWGMLMAMPSLSLFGGYLASRANKTLLGTGDLAAMAPRRLAETANWWVEVTSPGGLGRFSPGFQGIVRVRIMHAHVRAAMRRRPDWDYERWDHPVNQVQTVGTLSLFSLGLLAGTQALGLRFSTTERQAVYHLWRYVGWLLGIDPRLLPVDEADTWRLFWAEAATEFLPDQDSYRLAQALLDAVGPVILRPLLNDDGPAYRIGEKALRNLLGSYSRLVLGNHNADLLGAPNHKLFQAAVIATASLNLSLETLRGIIPGATRLSEHLGHTTRQAMIQRILTTHRGDRTYHRHDNLHTTPPAHAQAG
jgi:hypothetical protein